MDTVTVSISVTAQVRGRAIWRDRLTGCDQSWIGPQDTPIPPPPTHVNSVGGGRDRHVSRRQGQSATITDARRGAGGGARLALGLDSHAAVAGRGSRLRGQVGPGAGPVLSSVFCCSSSGTVTTAMVTPIITRHIRPIYSPLSLVPSRSENVFSS